MIDPHIVQATRDRLLKAIEPLGETDVERAKRIGFTVRTLDYWASGIGLVTLARLEAAGLVHIVDGSCTCQQQIEQPESVAA